MLNNSDDLLAEIATDIIAKDHHYLCEFPGGRPRSLAQDLLPKNIPVSQRKISDLAIPLETAPLAFMQDRYASHTIQLALQGQRDLSGNGNLVVDPMYASLYQDVGAFIRSNDLSLDSKRKLDLVVEKYNLHHPQQQVCMKSLLKLS
jgi:hypothetical protein